MDICLGWIYNHFAVAGVVDNKMECEHRRSLYNDQGERCGKRTADQGYTYH